VLSFHAERGAEVLTDVHLAVYNSRLEKSTGTSRMGRSRRYYSIDSKALEDSIYQTFCLKGSGLFREFPESIPDVEEEWRVFQAVAIYSVALICRQK